MTSETEPGGPFVDLDVRVLVVAQILLVAGYFASWWATGFDDTPGRNLTDMITIVLIALSIPAFLSGSAAGLVARRSPRARRLLLIAFSLLAAAAAWFLYVKAPYHCDSRDLPFDSRCSGSPSWKDALGAFVGAELAIVFQVFFAELFAAIARKYPLRKPSA